MVLLHGLCSPFNMILSIFLKEKSYFFSFKKVWVSMNILHTIPNMLKLEIHSYDLFTYKYSRKKKLKAEFLCSGECTSTLRENAKWLLNKAMCTVLPKRVHSEDNFHTFSQTVNINIFSIFHLKGKKIPFYFHLFLSSSCKFQLRYLDWNYI